mgnify:CR=1 FL=1
MSNSIYYLGAAGSLASLALGPGIWALVDATTHTRQVCASTTDNHVKNAMILDFAQFFTCMLVFALPLYRLRIYHGAENAQLPRHPPPSGEITKLAYAFMFSSFAVLVSIVIISGLVCSDNNCITTDAANDAQVQNNGPYHAQVHKMIGVKQSCTNGGSFQPAYFKVPNNYCPENVISISASCGAATDPGGAEKCLVYACSNLVEGRQARFVTSLMGLLLQIIAMYLVLLFEQALEKTQRRATAIITALPVGADNDKDMMLRSELRRRVTVQHSSTPGKIEF